MLWRWYIRIFCHKVSRDRTNVRTPQDCSIKGTLGTHILKHAGNVWSPFKSLWILLYEQAFDFRYDKTCFKHQKTDLKYEFCILKSAYETKWITAYPLKIYHKRSYGIISSEVNLFHWRVTQFYQCYEMILRAISFIK